MNKERELPQAWVWTTLGDIRIDQSKTIEPNKFSELFFELYSVPSFELKVPEIVLGSAIGSNKQTVETGTVLLCKINPRINRAWVVGHFSDCPKIASTEWISFFKLQCLNPKYLCYYLSLKTFRDYLASNASGVGGSLMRINSHTIVNYLFPLAPLLEQQRIVLAIEERFTILDAVTTTLQQNKQKLKRTRASVLKHAVEGKLTEKWRAEHPATESGQQLLEHILTERRAKWEAEQLAKGKDLKKLRYEEPKGPDASELPELPEGWCWARAEQFCEFITKGTTPAADKLHNEKGDIPFIKVYNLTHNGYLDFSVKPTFVDKDTHTHDLARSKVFPGDVLMNIVGPPLGKVSVVPDTYSEWNINQAIVFFRPIDGYNSKLLVISILTEHILVWATKRAKTTAGQRNLTLEICRDLPFPLPPLAEQQQIVVEVERRLSVIEQAEIAVETSLKRIERARQSILELAFSGRLVPQDPHDEPASVLLERIQEERTRRVVEGKQCGSNRGVKVARGKKAKEQEFVPQWQLLRESQPSELVDGSLSGVSVHENGAADKSEVEHREMGKDELVDLVQMPLLWD